jgi:serine/threonine-protein kinase
MLELRVLGPISLKRSDGTDVEALLAQPKRLALAAYLAAPPPHGGRCFHRKDTLVSMFWPELDQQHARAALRNALYFLRGALGSSVIRSRGDEDVGLDSDELWCDLDAFDVAMQMRDYPAAIQLYRGELLQGVFVSDAQPFEEWLDAQRGRRIAEAQQAASQAARRDAAAGRLAQALTWARRARALAPLNEDALRLVIALRYLVGDRAGALDEHSKFEALLREEHDVAPSPETRRLVDAVRSPDTDRAAIAVAIRELPLLKAPLDRVSTAPSRQPSADTDLYTAAVLEAVIRKRLGLARRRGERLGIVSVRLGPDRVPRDAVQEHEVERSLRELSQTVLEGVRGADLVASFGWNTVVVLPAEDAVPGLNALVGRLRAHLRSAWSMHRQIATADEPEVGAAWLDPKDARPVAEILTDVLGSRKP